MNGAMSDTRVAALAAALEEYFGPSWWPGLTDVTIIGDDCTVIAGKILDRLPPDWCGHDGPLGPYYRKEIARLRGEVMIYKPVYDAVTEEGRKHPELLAALRPLGVIKG